MTPTKKKAVISKADEDACARPWFLYSIHPPLSVTHKEIAKEFHPTKNGNFTADDFTYGSTERVWWKCVKNEEHPPWKTNILSRTICKSGCPYCAGKKAWKKYNLKVLFPELMKEWLTEKNPGLWPSELLPMSGKVWWQCSKNKKHQWQTSISSRTFNGSGCPFCSGNQSCNSNSLAALLPDLAKQWEAQLNGSLTPADVTLGSNKFVWWKCPAGPDHIFQTLVKLRVTAFEAGTSGCPYCHSLKPSVTNRLSVLFPEVAAEWHKTENHKLGLSLENMVAKSSKKVWWICSNNRAHKWQAKITDRTTKLSGCPYCNNKRASTQNNLVSKFPEIASQWHPKKNGKLSPRQVLPMSGKSFWWQCPVNKKHEWQARVSARTAFSSACPFCK